MTTCEHLIPARECRVAGCSKRPKARSCYRVRLEVNGRSWAPIVTAHSPEEAEQRAAECFEDPMPNGDTRTVVVRGWTFLHVAKASYHAGTGIVSGPRMRGSVSEVIALLVDKAS